VRSACAAPTPQGAVDSQIEIKKNKTIYIEKQSGWKDHYSLARFTLKVLQLGLHPRSLKMVTSCVIEPTLTTSESQDDMDILLDAIRKKLKAEGRPEDAVLTAGWIVGVAKDAGIAPASPKQTANGYRQQVAGILDSLLQFAAVEKLAKKGAYQLATASQQD
jgi:hypothetical protein